MIHMLGSVTENPLSKSPEYKYDCSIFVISHYINGFPLPSVY